MRLYEYQKYGVEFLKTHPKALLADEMGLGKTVQAIRAVREMELRKVLILCPASAKYVWRKEFEKWAPEYEVATIEGTRAEIPDTDVTIVNYDLIHRPVVGRQLLRGVYHALICDEAHYLKNSRAKRTRIVFNKNGLVDISDNVWLLTGTPVLNRPVELYPALCKLIPKRLGKFCDYMNFTKRYCAAYKDRFAWNVRGSSNLEELAGLLDGFMLRRLKKDVLKELPDKIFQQIALKAPEGYEEAIKAELAQYKENPNALLGAFATTRRELGIKKLPLIMDHLKNVLKEKEKIVVFAYHREVLSCLKDQLIDYHPTLLYGGLTTKQKEETIRYFRKEKRCRVFLGQIEAAGVGVDGLQDVADTVIFAELSWTPGQINQAIDRCHRIGQQNKVLVQFLIVENSLDEYILNSITEKTKIITKIIEKGEKFMAKAHRSIEENLQLIADLLSDLLEIASVAVQKPGTPATSAAPEPEKEIDMFGDQAEEPCEFSNPQELLAYCNEKVVAIEDKNLARSIGQTVMSQIKKEFNVTNIGSLPNDPKTMNRAKAILDTVIKKLAKGAAK